MLFNSIDFLFFFPSVWLVFYFLKSTKSRSHWLLSASLFFYGYWKIEYLFLLIATSTVDFLAAKYIDCSSSQPKRKIALVLSISSNVLILSFFKYGHFIYENINALFPSNEAPAWLDVLLPIGVSFYTFQAMAYVLDVYKNRLPAEKSYPKFLLFITFFPQLVAGPVERAPHLLGQLKMLELPGIKKIIPALGLICLGFWKKLFVADRLGVYVDSVFDNVETSNGAQLLIGTLFFGFQIYFDFSGYSDNARGIARFFGINLMLNFNKPYSSKTLTEFWRRWHISLSGWFRDYLYQPLGGSKIGHLPALRNILIVFLISGLWHGASWSFVVWGLWHGVGLCVERILNLSKVKSIFYQFVVLIWIFSGWIFFRTNSNSDLLLSFDELLNLKGYSFKGLNLFGSDWELLLSVTGIFGLLIFEKYNLKFSKWSLSMNHHKQLALLTFMFILLIWVGKFKGQDFIYFQF